MTRHSEPQCEFRLPCVHLLSSGLQFVEIEDQVAHNSLTVHFSLTYFIMHGGVLPTSLCTSHMQCLQRPIVGVSFPGTGVADSCKLNHGFSTRTAHVVPLTAKPPTYSEVGSRGWEGCVGQAGRTRVCPCCSWGLLESSARR